GAMTRLTATVPGDKQVGDSTRSGTDSEHSPDVLIRTSPPTDDMNTRTKSSEVLFEIGDWS
ncbi:hypothetical protein AB0D13_40250, partial [Streptomyces sp. NPDC048430]|uniref:hypothetical protein n=1 Tax=Streptomyces sp. NPDC048430 TaxID=3155388 RepID=UPI00341B9831